MLSSSKNKQIGLDGGSNVKIIYLATQINLLSNQRRVINPLLVYQEEDFLVCLKMSHLIQPITAAAGRLLTNVNDRGFVGGGGNQESKWQKHTTF